MIDTHAHYDDRMFDGDREELLGSFPGNGVRAVITVGCDLRSSLDSLSLAKAYPYVYAACGIHPEHAETGDPDALIPLLAHPKAVAVGEIGLDYHYDTPSREVQMRIFRRQLALAGELGKPVIIHDRDAHGDILSVLRGCGNVTGVLHSYSGSWETAKELLARGWYISFSGVVTFKNARQVLEVAKNVPADRFLTETDCPYLTPEPFRGKRNDSLKMRHTLERLAEIRGTTFEEIERQSERNAAALFRLPVRTA